MRALQKAIEPAVPDREDVIFVGSPADVQHERRIAREVIEALAEDDHISRRVRPFLYEADFDRFSATREPQQEVQERLTRASVLVCIFGERLGTPLPAEFVGAPEVISLEELEPPVRHPWPAKEEADASRCLPLTGTLYEFLLARKARKHLFVYIKGDDSVFQREAPPEERNLGFGRLHAELRGKAVRLSRKSSARWSRHFGSCRSRRSIDRARRRAAGSGGRGRAHRVDRGGRRGAASR